MEAYPLFRGAYLAMLGEVWEVELPRAWLEAFRAAGPGIIAQCRDEPDAWNLYRSGESFAFHARDAAHPRCLLDLSARGTFRLRRELRRPQHRPGTRLLFLGQGMWVQLWIESTFRALLRAGVPDADVEVLKRLGL